MRVVLGLGVVVLAGCNPGFVDQCREGYVFDATHSTCVLANDGGIESGVDAGDAGHDAALDAHVPCNGACTGATPHCLASGATETCVGCTGESDCSGTTPHCEPTSHTCVACVDSAQCTAVGMSRCDATAHTCMPCAANADCTHLTGTTICNAASSTCVQCTATDRTACASGVCLADSSTCAAAGGATATCAPCAHDAECAAGQVCVGMTYDDPTTPATDPVPVGNRCLWRQDAYGTGAPNGDCFTNEPPYVRATTTTSVDGTGAMVCALRVSTCEAQAGFSNTNCMTLDMAGDALCGVTAIHDGVCRMASAGANRCTVFCGSSDDCPTGFACNTAASPRVCMF